MKKNIKKYEHLNKEKIYKEEEFYELINAKNEYLKTKRYELSLKLKLLNKTINNNNKFLNKEKINEDIKITEKKDKLIDDVLKINERDEELIENIKEEENEINIEKKEIINEIKNEKDGEENEYYEFLKKILERIEKISNKRLDVIRDIETKMIYILNNFRKWNSLHPMEKILNSKKFEDDLFKLIDDLIKKDQNYEFFMNYEFINCSNISEVIKNNKLETWNLAKVHYNIDNMEEYLNIIIRDFGNNIDTFSNLQVYSFLNSDKNLTMKYIEKLEDLSINLNWFESYGFYIKQTFLFLKYKE